MAKLVKYNSLKKLLTFYKKHIKLYIMFVIILIIKAVISFFSAMLVAKIIANIMETNFEEVIKLSTINLIILVIYNILSYINTYFYKNLENRVKYDLQQKVIETCLNMKMQYFDTASTGTIVTRLTTDIDYISERFKALTEATVNIIRRISYLVYIFILDFYIGVFVFISVLIVSLAYTIRIHYLSKLKPEVKAQREEVNSKIIETFRAVKDIKTLNCDKNILSLIGKEQDDYIKKDNHEYYVGVALCKLTDLTIHVSDFIFIILSVILIINNDLTVAVFYTCYLYKDHTFSLANELGDLRYKLAECEVCANRLIELVYPKNCYTDKYGNTNLKNYKGDINFNNVEFSYINKRKVLKGISFYIKPKSTIALVGESGCGKSTIIGLIGHLYYKDSGSIKFGDTEIDKLDKNFIKDNIIIINQFPYLFNISIRENFQIINPSITDDEIWDLCDKVLLKNYIESLPHKLDSIIGEGGCQLSGGQRQKLCIARALCKNVKVIIFDEATSSLDNASQDEVMQVIKNLSKELTIIIISHRLSTITFADSIILLKEGEIIDINTHKNLLNNNEYYKSLYLKSNTN